MNRRDEILSRLDAVPALPSSIISVMRLVRDPDIDVAKLVRTIEMDPGTAANVLRLANSAYFGARHSVGSIRDAIVRLGINRIHQLVLAAAIAPLARRGIRGYDVPPGGLWRHSVSVAIGTDELAAAVKVQPPEYTFTAALLHDLGKIVMGTFIEVDAAPIMRLAAEEEVPFDVAEREVLGIDHAEVGAALLDAWDLPADLVHVVRWHHSPESFDGEPLVIDLVHVADVFSLESGIGAGADGGYYRTSEAAVGRLHMDAAMKEQVTGNVLASLEELDGIFPAGG